MEANEKAFIPRAQNLAACIGSIHLLWRHAIPAFHCGNLLRVLKQGNFLEFPCSSLMLGMRFATVLRQSAS